jgi:DNA-binding NarL/FixJ family response regulator
MILYLAADLLWASKIKATADALGLPCRPVRNLDMLEARLADSPVRALIVDLDVAEKGRGIGHQASGISIKQDPAAASLPIRVLAFGPHIEKNTLQAARDAGADDVLTRGAFDHHMDEVLTKLAAGGVG